MKKYKHNYTMIRQDFKGVWIQRLSAFDYQFISRLSFFELLAIDTISVTHVSTFDIFNLSVKGKWIPLIFMVQVLQSFFVVGYFKQFNDSGNFRVWKINCPSYLQLCSTLAETLPTLWQSCTSDQSAFLDPNNHGRQNYNNSLICSLLPVV